MPLLSNMPSRFLGGGRLPVPVPTLGAELLTDGGFENWASATDLTSWTETKQGSSTIERTTDAHSGTYACKRVIDASNSLAALSQTTPTVGTWYSISCWAKAEAGAKPLRWGIGASFYSVPVAATYTQYYRTVRATIVEGIVFTRDSANDVIYVDDASLKAITLASMFSTRAYSTHVTVKAMATIVAGTRAGVVCNLDSATSPANAVLASHDGTNIRLTKLVAGTYTELVNTAVTYVAGAYVEIRRAVGTNTYSVWYNGSKVGADQTIADATVIDNVLAGLFNTFASNQLTGFSCVPSA